MTSMKYGTQKFYYTLTIKFNFGSNWAAILYKDLNIFYKDINKF